jgi:hypothetical protein
MLGTVSALRDIKLLCRPAKSIFICKKQFFPQDGIFGAADTRPSLRWRRWQGLFFHRNHRDYKPTWLIRFFFCTFMRFGWICGHVRHPPIFLA